MFLVLFICYEGWLTWTRLSFHYGRDWYLLVKDQPWCEFWFWLLCIEMSLHHEKYWEHLNAHLYVFLYRPLLFCLKEVSCGISPVCLSVLVTYDYNYNPSKIYEKIPLVHPKTLTRRKKKKKQEVGGNLSLCMHFIRLLVISLVKVEISSI